MSATLTQNPIRPEWLAASVEEPLEPTIPIVDSHHHLYRRPTVDYLSERYLDDIAGGHNVRASVYVQARSMYRLNGDDVSCPVGETEFANGVAAMSASGAFGDIRLCAAIVGFADLGRGSSVRGLLEHHIAAGGGTQGEGGRFRGIRQPLTWDQDRSLFNGSAYPTSWDTMDSAGFRAGFGQLEELKLSFDAWLLFTQLPKLTDLARSFPGVPIAVNHCGGVVGIGRFSNAREQVFEHWKENVKALAECPNVTMKLSGLGMQLSGFGFEENEKAPSSADLARTWRPWYETCLELFGSDRCMYGSNFPVDKGSYTLGNGINALKRILSGAGTEQVADVLWRTAANFYKLPQGKFYERAFSEDGCAPADGREDSSVSAGVRTQLNP